MGQKLRSNFFTAEQEVGVLREVETLVAEHGPLLQELPALIPSFTERDVQRAVRELLEEKRVSYGEDGRLQVGAR